MINYHIELAEPLAHRLRVRCTVENPQKGGEQFRLPTWIPGSYLIREFARHVVEATAEQNGSPVILVKTDKQTWQTGPLASDAPLTVTLLVHAWDLSVRGAHFDQHHAFFNGCSVFPEVVSRPDELCGLSLGVPFDFENRPWSLFTTLPLESPLSYWEMLDHPIEMGIASQYQVLEFVAAGTPHRMVIRGAGCFAKQRLVSDLEKICTTVIRFFGGQAPFEKYDFLVTLTGDGYGGLEHRSSTALLASRDDLPPPDLVDEQPPGEAYARFLELCAHEYFHAWVVKRICDHAFTTSSLQSEAYSTLLWFFEGFTSYYDALMLVRAGIIDHNHYLSLLEKTLTQVGSVPGQWRQSVSESSFDAWIKYYRPDDNTPNSVVSYYAKGSLIALGLDSLLHRQESSADTWVNSLWECFGKTGIGLTEAAVFDHLTQFAGPSVANQLQQWVTARVPLPIESVLADMGISLTWEPIKGVTYWGLRVTEDRGLVKISHVLDGSAAQQAGLAAGDLLVAIDNLRVTAANLETRLQRIPTNTPVTVLVFREDALKTLALSLPHDAQSSKQAVLALDGTDSERVAKRTKWLQANGALL
jgi:predicted metalloprotease with PDZ domain